MRRSLKVINEILVELFNDILTIEELSVSSIGQGDLSITEVHTIDAIGLKEPKSMSFVANKLKITVGTLTTSINRLVKKGYVLRQKHKDDKRIVLITLTDKGKEVYKGHQAFHLEMVTKLTQDLKIHEDDILIKSLENLRDFFKQSF